jgi:probable F420-dependent oxidoreductase
MKCDRESGVIMQVGVTMPMGKHPLRRYPEMAKAAEDAGMDSVWTYEVYENPLIVLAAAALSTSRIQLGTGVVTALSRTPFELANAAADVDQLSDGRLLLGVGMGIPGLMATLHGADVDHPLARMREYAQALRECWSYLSGGEAQEFAGTHYRFTPLPGNLLGTRVMARRIPLYLGGMNPAMIRVAGQYGDGLVGGGYSREFVTDTVRPNLARGAELAGRNPADIDVITQVVCCVSTDRDEALRRARIHVGQLVLNPVSDGVVAAHGLERQRDDVRAALMAGGPGALADVTADELVETFSIAGSPQEGREQLARWEGVVDHVMLHPPYVPPLCADETADAYYQILAAFQRDPQPHKPTPEPIGAAR